jgi:hypothetical protein
MVSAGEKDKHDPNKTMFQTHSWHPIAHARCWACNRSLWPRGVPGHSGRWGVAITVVAEVLMHCGLQHKRVERTGCVHHSHAFCIWIPCCLYLYTVPSECAALALAAHLINSACYAHITQV